MKHLFFDTCAIVKLFTPENGSETVWWIVRNRQTYGFIFSVSFISQIEFSCAIWKKAAYGCLSLLEAKSIIRRSHGYFRDVFRARDKEPIPQFRSGIPFSYGDVVRKYNLTPGKNDRDAWHVMCIHNYLRCFRDESRPVVVTSDANVKKMAVGEGFKYIDPEKVTAQELKQSVEKIGQNNQ